MTDSTIGVAEPGTPTKQLQSYQNTVSGQSVQAEGVVQVDLLGVPVPRGSVAEPVRVDPTGTTTQPIKLTDGGGTNIVDIVQPGTLSLFSIGTNPTALATAFDQSLLEGAPGILTQDLTGKLKTVGGASKITASLTANGQSLSMSLQGGASCKLSGSWTATLQFEGSADNTVWVPARVRRATDDTVATSTTSNGTFYLLDIGFSQFRARVSAFTSGSIASTIASIIGNSAVYAKGVTPGSTDAGLITRIVGQDLNNNLPVTLASIPNPANLPLLSIDPQGSLQVNNNNLRAVEERMMMLAELAAVNSLIGSDNGPGARNYQELR